MLAQSQAQEHTRAMPLQMNPEETLRAAKKSRRGNPYEGTPLQVSGRLASHIKQSFGINANELAIRESPEVAEMGARATAQGNAIRFAPGEFRPDTREGMEVLGHELNHVREQATGGVHAPGGEVFEHPRHEAASDKAGEAFASGSLSAAAPVSVGGMSAGAAPVQGSRLGKFMRKHFISNSRKELEDHYGYEKDSLPYNLVAGYKFAPFHWEDAIINKVLVSKARKEEKKKFQQQSATRWSPDMDEEYADMAPDIRDILVGQHKMEADYADDRLAEMNAPKGMSRLDRMFLPKKQAPTSLSQGPADPRIANVAEEKRMKESAPRSAEWDYIPPPSPQYATAEDGPQAQHTSEREMSGPQRADYFPGSGIDVGQEIFSNNLSDRSHRQWAHTDAAPQRSQAVAQDMPGPQYAQHVASSNIDAVKQWAEALRFMDTDTQSEYMPAPHQAHYSAKPSLTERMDMIDRQFGSLSMNEKMEQIDNMLGPQKRKKRWQFWK